MSKIVMGIGINDEFRVSKNSKPSKAYQAWAQMIVKTTNPEASGYVADGVICKDWLTFSKFKEWFDKNHVDGWVMDRGILNPNDNIFSPDHCVFVPRHLSRFARKINSNNMFGLTGVSRITREGAPDVYVSSIRIAGKNVHLGSFSNAIDAHKAYCARRSEVANNYKSLCESIRPGLFDCLIKRVKYMENM